MDCGMGGYDPIPDDVLVSWHRKPLKEHGDKTYWIQIGDEVVVVIMPPGSQSITRAEWEQRLGTALALAGEALDVGELIEILFSSAPFVPDISSFFDVGVTQISTWLTGQSPRGDQYNPSLPPLFGTNQDVLVQLADFVIAFEAKVTGLSLGGPIGYAVGTVVDAVTTSANLIYDHNRNFGSLGSYITIGTPVGSDSSQWGKTYIIIWR
jgi:hypothetical protein